MGTAGGRGLKASAGIRRADNTRNKMTAEPHCKRHGCRAGLKGTAWSLAVLGALVCANAHAQSAFSPYASVEYEHNSNLFALPDDISLVPGADPHRADTDLKYLAGLEGAYAFGLQQITFDAQWRHFDYDHFNNLDHNEYLLDGKFLWKLASALDGKIDYRQEHLMEPFAQRISLVLALETDTKLEGTANWNIGSSWRLEGGVGEHRLDAPQAGLPTYGLREQFESGGLKYVAISNLSFGVTDLYTEGKFHGADVPDYTQNTVQLDVSEKLSGGRSTFSGSVGYTDRHTQGPGGSTTATVGSLSYARQLTGKTHVNLSFNRSINSYITTASSEIDTGVTAGAQWAATSKLSVAVQYQYLHADFAAQPALDPINAGRKDHAQQGDLSIDYQALSWLKLHLYGELQRRDSNIPLFTYDTNIVGLQVTARIGAAPAEQP